MAPTNRTQVKSDSPLTVNAASASYGTTAPGSSLLEESLLDSLVQQELQLRQRASGLSSGSADTPEDETYKLGSISLTPGLSDPRLMGFGGADDASGGLPGAAKPHICYDFTKGLCNRGDKCKYSHDLATIVTYNSKEKGICFDYLRNQCQRGLLCRFSHDLSNIAQQCQPQAAPTAAPSPHSQSHPGSCPLCAPTPYLGPQAAAAPSPSLSGSILSRGRTTAICYDFVKGVCQRGGECRYSHDLTLIARTARGGAGAAKVGEVCYDHLRGRCTRGPSCKYSHNISFLAAPGYLPPGELSPPGGGEAGWGMEGGALSDAAYHLHLQSQQVQLQQQQHHQQQQQDSNNMMAMMMMMPHQQQQQHRQQHQQGAGGYSHPPVLDPAYGYGASSLSDPGPPSGAFGQEADGRQVYGAGYPRQHHHQQQQQHHQPQHMHGGYYQQPQPPQQQEVDQAMLMMMGGMGGPHQPHNHFQQQHHQQQQFQYHYQQQQQQQRARAQSTPAHSAIHALAAAQQQEFARAAGERTMSSSGGGMDTFARQLSSGSQRGSSAHLADNLSSSASEPQLSRLDNSAAHGMTPSHSQTVLGSVPMTSQTSQQQLQWMAAASVEIQNLQLQQAINSAAQQQQQHDTMVISQAVAIAKAGGGVGGGYSSSSLPNKQGGLSADAEGADPAPRPSLRCCPASPQTTTPSWPMPLPGNMAPRPPVLSGARPTTTQTQAVSMHAHRVLGTSASSSALSSHPQGLASHMPLLSGTSPATISQLSSPNSSLSRSGSTLPPRAPTNKSLSADEALDAGVSQPSLTSAPKPIPGRSSHANGHAVGVNSYSEGFGYHQHQGGGAVSPSSGGGIFGGEGLMSRTAPGLRPLSLSGGVPLSSDLLPMIKEIWSKPGFGSQAGSQAGSLDVGRGYGSLMSRGGGLGEVYGSFGSLA
ncbi:MAG: hypothetical protein WDW38_010779 [Sanguina aurantia]